MKREFSPGLAFVMLRLCSGASFKQYDTFNMFNFNPPAEQNCYWFLLKVERAASKGFSQSVLRSCSLTPPPTGQNRLVCNLSVSASLPFSHGGAGRGRGEGVLPGASGWERHRSGTRHHSIGRRSSAPEGRLATKLVTFCFIVKLFYFQAQQFSQFREFGSSFLQLYQISSFLFGTFSTISTHKNGINQLHFQCKICIW